MVNERYFDPSAPLPTCNILHVYKYVGMCTCEGSPHETFFKMLVTKELATS